MKQRRSIFSLLLLASIFGSLLSAGVVFSVNIAPPPIAVFDQPEAPADGYILEPPDTINAAISKLAAPGPRHWVYSSSVGMLWTPGYWGHDGGRYLWHEGYWGQHVGFYGGVNYGGGYFGSGFTGGRWEGGNFHHNTVISNVNRNNVHNTYEDRTVVHEVKGPNHSYNGQGGSQARPTHEEEQASHAPHQGPTPQQVTHAQAAHDSHVQAHGGPRQRRP